MQLLLLVALLIGTQVGLSDGLVLPALVAQNGEGSFLLLYGFFKILFILPLLQAELVAGRLYRITPFEFCFRELNRSWSRLGFTILLLALVFILAINLFNMSWALIFGLDGLRGDLLSLRPLDQNLYWFEQSQNINRIMTFVIAQGIVLMLLGGLPWRAIASVFVLLFPLLALFILWSIPDIIGLFSQLDWPMLSFSNVLVAMQHALSSSMVGLMVWYVLGTKISDYLPTSRVIIFVQTFDLMFGLALLSISWGWLSALDGTSIDAGTVLRALMASLEQASEVPRPVVLWLSALCLVGMVSCLPLLLLVAEESSALLRQWLLAVTVIVAVFLAGVLIFSHGTYSPLTWYGQPIYQVLQRLSHGVIIPSITACVAIGIGWLVWPNKVLRQINPHGGVRYFLWRVVLKFVVPIVLGLVFARASLALLAVSPWQILFGILAVLLFIRLFRWVQKRAIFPSL